MGLGVLVSVLAGDYVRMCLCEGVGWVLEFYLLAISKIISGRVPTCESGFSRWLYSVAPLVE